MYYCRLGRSALPGLLCPIKRRAGRCRASPPGHPFARPWVEREDPDAEGCAPSLEAVPPRSVATLPRQMGTLAADQIDVMAPRVASMSLVSKYKSRSSGLVGLNV